MSEWIVWYGGLFVDVFGEMRRIDVYCDWLTGSGD